MDMEWRQLPSIMGDAEQVLFDTQTGKLLYILKSQDAGIKLAVEFDFIKKDNPAVNMIVSGFRQATKTIEEKIRGGIYEVVE
ncbi:hypothetical protein [Methylomonas koyamae]|uniref:hypothetical protein n=1 Tax=Methylomonas koyamae TaxID=702114 RepID=UPI0007C970D4|nr:hypothetical protein [Methylomonas koyamae]